MRKRMLVGICGLAVAMLGAGSAQAARTTARENTIAARQDAEAKTKSVAKKTVTVLTDAEITTAVKTKFLANTKVSGLNISVDTTKGVVTLTGPVSSMAEKSEALRVARNTHGVKRVISKLTLEKKK